MSFLHNCNPTNADLVALPKHLEKVNYAVTEKEDGVTGVTKLTRMTSCTRLYRALLGFTFLATVSRRDRLS